MSGVYLKPISLSTHPPAPLFLLALRLPVRLVIINARSTTLLEEGSPFSWKGEKHVGQYVARTTKYSSMNPDQFVPSHCYQCGFQEDKCDYTSRPTGQSTVSMTPNSIKRFFFLSFEHKSVQDLQINDNRMGSMLNDTHKVPDLQV